ncbi:MAG: hypothetical protein JWP65_2175 [Ramlibacter sp.]|uniref:DUF4149 domain-containing protein n=1 Tax=Ramlibacter sp. TaxID=1917967 RepID=UPI00260F7F70|nr:DUF4149 domain-containing protein [Ramlibacter sp.]MDB5751754.1 hypothetical protein [Ramlibacter sp.]
MTTVGWKPRIPVLAAAFWWGSLGTVGLLVVPALFANAATPALAGGLAAKLFGLQTWVSLACGMVILASARERDGTSRIDWAQGALAYVIGGMLMALLAQFAVAPRIVARQNLPLWHSVGTLLYAAQWLCALVVLWRTTGWLSRPGVS